MLRYLLLLCMILCVACSGPTKTASDTSSLEQTARQLQTEQRYQEAADLWMKLARNDKKNASRYQLYAADVLLQIPDITQAEKLLPSAQASLTANELALLQLLKAEIAISKGEEVTALQELNVATGSNDKNLQIRRLQLTAQLYKKRRKYHNALLAYTQLYELHSTIPEQEQVVIQTWELLATLPAEKLYRLRQGDEPVADAWYELAILYQNMVSREPRVYRDALNGWRINHPLHPAADTLLPGLMQNTPSAQLSPQHIGLLLPFSGIYAESAAAILRGIVAAWYDDPARNKTKISTYNTHNREISDVYQQVLNDKVDFVIGPLIKENLKEMLSVAKKDPPILGLNQIDYSAITTETETQYFFQLSLSPEQEAAQIAERLWFEGHTSTLVIYPSNRWGRRMLNSFKTSWQSLGGNLADEYSYTPDADDYSRVVSSLLKISSSEQRTRELQNFLGVRLHSVSQSRTDAESIVLFATAANGQLIMPQLRFHAIDKTLTVYASSAINQINTNPVSNTDLDGLIFPDLPWIVDQRQKLSSLYVKLDEHWNIQNSPQQRLYALGIDAYQLIEYLPIMLQQKNYLYSGATGILNMEPDGRIRQRLSWARFANGVPQALETQ